jgi:hypothetical protein
MGCTSSAPDVVDDKQVERRAAEQRRRLSVAPQHVGDITQQATVDKSPSSDDHLHPEVVEKKAGSSTLLTHAFHSKKGCARRGHTRTATS